METAHSIPDPLDPHDQFAISQTIESTNSEADVYLFRSSSSLKSALYDINVITLPIAEPLVKIDKENNNTVEPHTPTGNVVIENTVHNKTDAVEENSVPPANENSSLPAKESKPFTSPLRENVRSRSSSSVNTCVACQSKTPVVPLQPIKRVIEERPPAEKKQDSVFVPPNCPPPRISRMTALSPEEHERLQIENAKKIEAVKMTMAEVVPSVSKGKRPGILIDPAAPPKKRGRPKGSVNKARMIGARSSLSQITAYPRNGYLRKKSHTAAVRSCTDLTDGASRRHFASPKSQHVPTTLNEEDSSAKRRKDGGRERARSWASTGSAELCSRNKRRRDLSAHSSNTSDDGGCVTPPLRIVEETAAEIANSRESRNASDRSREARLEREADSWIRYLIKELTSLLPSMQDDQKLKIACTLQRIICEQRDLQHLMSMVTLLETEVNEQFQHSRDDAEQLLDEHCAKCNRKSIRINDSINSLRNDVARLLDMYGSLQQIVTKHTDEMEALKTTFRKSCNSVKQSGAELKARLESLRKDKEVDGANSDERRFQNDMCNLPALFPPPPPPPPTASGNEKRSDTSPPLPGNANPLIRQRLPPNRTPDNLRASTSGRQTPANGNGATNSRIAPPFSPPFYGSLLPPPQKLMYDYFQLQHLQQMQNIVPPPLAPFLPNVLMENNHLSLPFQRASAEQHNARGENLTQQRCHNGANENSEYASKLRR